MERTERLTYDKATLSAELLEKIKKLFTLTQSPNENEAAVASAMAMKLLAKYNLTKDDFDQQVAIIEETLDEEVVEGKYVSWKHSLMTICAVNCFCMAFRREVTKEVSTSIPGFTKPKKFKELVICGSAVNRQVAIHLFNYLSEVLPQIERFEFNRVKPTNVGPGTAERWYESFKHGFITRIRERLEQQRAEITREAVGETAIVRADPYEVAQNQIARHYNSQGMGFDKVKTTSASKASAYEVGRDAGDRVSLNPAQQLGDRYV